MLRLKPRTGSIDALAILILFKEFRIDISPGEFEYVEHIFLEELLELA
jgi:hypothetical protein